MVPTPVLAAGAGSIVGGAGRQGPKKGPAGKNFPRKNLKHSSERLRRRLPAAQGTPLERAPPLMTQRAQARVDGQKGKIPDRAETGQPPPAPTAAESTAGQALTAKPADH